MDSLRSQPPDTTCHGISVALREGRGTRRSTVRASHGPHFAAAAQPVDELAVPHFSLGSKAYARRLALGANAHTSDMWASVGISLGFVVVATTLQLLPLSASVWFLIGSAAAHVGAIYHVRRTRRMWQQAINVALSAAEFAPIADTTRSDVLARNPDSAPSHPD